MRRSARSVAVALVACVVVACAPLDDGPDDAAPIGDDRRPAADDRRPGDDHDVHIDGQDLVLTRGGVERVVHVLDQTDGRPAHVALRPGDHDADTVLLLARVEDDPHPRYELRYLVVTDDEVTDLYWFPWRLQVDDASAQVLDVPPIPVWAPDGSALAWIEWVEEGTRLRTVGWIDDGVSRNPSDDAASYRLDAVPAGAQLEAWHQDGDRPVLIGRHDGQPYRIEVEPGHRGRASVRDVALRATRLT